MRALRAEHATVDDHACRAAFPAYREGRNDDIGAPAVLLERSWMVNQGRDLALDRADTAEQIATESALTLTAARSSPSANNQFSKL